MANQVVVGNKFTWLIKDFSSLKSKVIFSDTFVIGGCKWRLRVYPKGDNGASNHLSSYLEVADSKTLPCGWRRRTKYRITVVNQMFEQLSQGRESQLCWFDEKVPAKGFREIFALIRIKPEGGGFLVNKELKIVVEIDVVQVIGMLDVTEESEAVKMVKLEAGVGSQEDFKSIDINGFQVLPSQVDFVKRIFEKHPDIAVGFRSKNSNLRKACMNSLLCLIDTLCQSPQELSSEDLAEAANALAYVKDAGFKVDWLEKKLYQVKEKRDVKETSESRMQELEKELKELKQKCSDVEALVDKEKARVVAAGASLTFDDIIMTYVFSSLFFCTSRMILDVPLMNLVSRFAPECNCL